MAGLAKTAIINPSAGFIFFGVLAAFAPCGPPTVKQFGVGLATAILIDATIVRCLLVPSLMILMGNANWWLPGWLDRVLPKVSIEGEEYFKEHPGAPVRQLPAAQVPRS